MTLIDDAETNVRKVIEAAKYLERWLQGKKEPTYKAVDPTYADAAAMYMKLRAELAAKVADMPVV